MPMPRTDVVLAPEVVAALASPPATGLLVYADARPPLEVGDVLVSLAGVDTPDREGFDVAYRAAFKKGDVDYLVVRGGRKTTLSADRAAAMWAGTVPVRKGKPLEIRPAATVAAPAYRPLDLECDRLMNAFGGKPGKVHGSEHHRLVVTRGKPVLQSEVEFESFGHHHFTCRSTSGRWEYMDVERGVSSKGKVAASDPADAVPSLLARLGALFLPPSPDTCWHYTPLAEDAGRSSFPLVPHAAPMALVGAAEEDLKVGRRTVSAFRFDHLRFGEAVATTWVDRDGNLVQHREFSTLLRPSPTG